MTHKEKLIRAAYKYSEELGKEVEALASDGADHRRLIQVRKLLDREFGEDATLVYETITSVFRPS